MSYDIEHYISPRGNFIYGFQQIKSKPDVADIPDVVNVAVYCRKNGPFFVGTLGNEIYSDGNFKVNISSQGEVLFTPTIILSFRKCIWHWMRWRGAESNEPQ